MDPLLPATPDTVDEALKTQALGHLRELLDLHWREASDSADEDGKFAIGFRVAVSDGAPARVKVTSRISRTVTDEIERSESASQRQPAGQRRGKALANREHGGLS